MTPHQLVSQAMAGNRRALSRLITIVESGDGGPVVADLYRRAGSAWVVGVTGAPGSGKSTLVDRLVGEFRRRGMTVATVLVDPSSPFTGGALLGDRVRMQDHVADKGVFMRSMATRGHLGGLADTTAQVVTVLAAVGFEVVIVETVGVGQSEVEVIEVADSTVVVSGPGSGDDVQAAKAGLLEVGDVLVVNKVDLPGADEVVRNLVQMLEMGPTLPWSPPVVKVSARTGEGMADLVTRLDEHREWLGRHPEVGRRRVEAAVRRAVAAELSRHTASVPLGREIIDEVVSGRLDPWSAAARVVADRVGRSSGR